MSIILKAKGVDSYNSTNEITAFLENVSLNDIQNPKTWKKLHTLVQVLPEGEVYPVRAKYDDNAYTIGANHLTSGTPQWFTLADCIAAKLSSGKTPKVIQALSFKPKDAQENLNPICVTGNKNYQVDPNKEDFFKSVIDLRREVKSQMKHATESKKSALDEQQLALKILANSTSYGIFVELNVEEHKNLQEFFLHGADGGQTAIKKRKFEEAGTFFIHCLQRSLQELRA